MVSHLLQMRGLKRKLDLQLFFKRLVASFTDAWIETSVPPADVAGPIVASFTDAWIETALSELVGAKSAVASFTDAWIETPRLKARYING